MPGSHRGDFNGRGAAVLLERRKPLLTEMEEWFRADRTSLPRLSPVSRPIDYILSRRTHFASDVDDGRICKSNNAEEKTLRCVAWGRKAWLFASSDRGAGRATSMLMLITITRTNDVAPRVWLAADIITGIANLL